MKQPAFLTITALLLASVAMLEGAEKTKPVIDGTSAEMWSAGTSTKTNLVRGAWLKDARFAMFIHWGLYSEMGGRWKGNTYYGIAEWIMNRARIPVAEYTW